MDITTLKADSADFNVALEELLSWDASEDASIVGTVSDIIDNIRQQGDAALVSYTEKFDQWPVSADDLLVDAKQLESAWDGLPDEQKTALRTAADRVRAYAEHQKLHSWGFEDEFGNTLGQKITALDRVGVYVPGGKGIRFLLRWQVLLKSSW